MHNLAHTAHLGLAWPQAALQGTGRNSQNNPQRKQQQKPAAGIRQRHRGVQQRLQLADQQHHTRWSKTVPGLEGPQSLGPAPVWGPTFIRCLS